MKFNSQLEDLERQNPELIQNLQKIYQISGEEKEALFRIEKRLSQSAPRPQLEFSLASSEPENITPITRSRTSEKRHEKKLWPQRLSLIAALLVVAFMTGAIVPMFGLTIGASPGSNGRPIGALPIRVGFVMFNEQDGWINDGYAPLGPVRRTTDGGKTWKSISLPQEISGKYFTAYAFDKDTLQIQPVYSAGFEDPLPYFYRTEDAGNTWQRYNWPTTPAIIQNDRIALDYTFLDTTHGWVNVLPARKLDEESYRVPEQTLFRTEDGGKTWQQVARLPFPYPIYDLTFIDTQTGWLNTIINNSANPDSTDPKSFSVVPFITQDGGRTWKQKSLPVPPQAIGKIQSLLDITFFSENEGYILAIYVQEENAQEGTIYKQYLLKTQDGGDSWQIIGVPFPERGIYYPWFILDSEHVFTELYMYTLSKGQWTKTSTLPPGATEFNVSFEFLSARVGMAVVDDLMLYKTRDGGKTWQKVGTLPIGP